jgi:rubredoxin
MKSRYKEASCPTCGFTSKYDTTALRLSPMKDLQCPECNLWFRPEAPAPKKGTNDNQRRSKAQEKRAAAQYGARVQPASGALPGAKGDLRKKGVMRGECKFTRSGSFSLKLAELLKVEQEAVGSETPLFEVEFQGVHPRKKYVVLRAEDYVALRDELEGLRSA